MFEGYQQEAWAKHSALMWAMFQPHAGKKKLKPDDFNPMANKAKPMVVSVGEAKGLIQDYFLADNQV